MKLPLSNLSAPWEAIMIELNENLKIFYINISCHFEPSNICIMEIDVEYHDDMNNLSTSRDWTKLDDNLMSLIKADWIESIRYCKVSNEKNMKVTRSNANQIDWKSCSMKNPWKFRKKKRRSRSHKYLMKVEEVSGWSFVSLPVSHPVESTRVTFQCS